MNKLFTDIIDIARSLQQGSGLSPSLYCTCIEVLLCKIYNSVLVKGIQATYGSIAVKLFAHADDTTVITCDIESVKEIIKIYEGYSKISGSKLNYNKCSILPISNCNSQDFTETGFRVVDRVKICGVTFGDNAQKENEVVLNGVQTAIKT